MQFYLISDNRDTLIGMRLAGIPGEIVHDVDSAQQSIETAIQNSNIAVVLVTEKIARLLGQKLDDIKLAHDKPIIIEIPDRHGTGRNKDSITRYIREAIGIKI